MNGDVSLLELPTGWEETSLGSVCRLINGDRGKNYPGRKSLSKDGIPFVNAGDLQDGQISTQRLGFIPPTTFELLRAGKFELGDILYCIRGSLGKVAFNSNLTSGGIASSLIIVRADPRIEPKYVFYYLLSPLASQMVQVFDNGTAQPNLSGADLAKFRIPLPGLGAQVKIVAKIEELFSELDKGVESLTTAREQLTAYRHSVLKAAFEGRLTDKWRSRQKTSTSAAAIVAEALAEKTRGKRPPPRDDDAVVKPAVPDAWGTVALGDLSVDIFDGPFGSNLKTSDYVDAGVRVIRLENIGHGRFIEDKHSYVSLEKFEGLKRHTIVPGDIVVSSFVTDAIRSAIVPGSVPISINKADCFAVRFQGQKMLPEFAQRFLESRCAYKQVEGMIHGVGRPRINTTQLKQVVLPICSRAEQIEVLSTLSAAYSEIDALDAELSAQMQKAAALRQAILKRAFSGQLVAQDAADEPALALLERICAEREAGGETKRRNNKNGKKEAA